MVQLAFWSGLVGAVVVSSRLRGTGDLRRDVGFDVRWRDAVIGLPVGLAMQVVMVPAIYLVVTRITGELDVSGPARELVDRASGVFAALAVRFGRLGVAIWSHVAFNATAVGSLLLFS